MYIVLALFLFLQFRCHIIPVFCSRDFVLARFLVAMRLCCRFHNFDDGAVNCVDCAIQIYVLSLKVCIKTPSDKNTLKLEEIETVDRGW